MSSNDPNSNGSMNTIESLLLDDMLYDRLIAAHHRQPPNRRVNHRRLSRCHHSLPVQNSTTLDLGSGNWRYVASCPNRG